MQSPTHSVPQPTFPEESVIEILGKAGNKRFYPKNTVILNVGDQSSTLYVIHSGKLKVFLANEQGREIVLNILGAGDHFGKMALLDNEVRSASVITMEDSQLTLVTKENLNEYLVKNPELATPLMLELIKSQRTSIRKIGRHALLDVHGRAPQAPSP